MNILTKIGAAVVVLPPVLIVGLLLGLYRALVMRCLWDWYAVPRGLPLLTVVEIYVAFMLKKLMFDSFRSKKTPEEKKNDASDTLNWIVAGVLVPSLYLLIGWYFR